MQLFLIAVCLPQNLRLFVTKTFDRRHSAGDLGLIGDAFAENANAFDRQEINTAKAIEILRCCPMLILAASMAAKASAALKSRTVLGLILMTLTSMKPSSSAS